MTKTGASTRAAGLLAVAALALGACGTAGGTSSQNNGAIASVAEMKSYLEDVRSAANDYGRDQLGHFLDLDAKRLRKQGLKIPESIRIDVETDHKGYCIQVETTGWDDSDPWATATVSSGIDGISSRNGCRL